MMALRHAQIRHEQESHRRIGRCSSNPISDMLQAAKVVCANPSFRNEFGAQPAKLSDI